MGAVLAETVDAAVFEGSLGVPLTWSTVGDVAVAVPVLAGSVAAAVTGSVVVELPAGSVAVAVGSLVVPLA